MCDFVSVVFCPDARRRFLTLMLDNIQVLQHECDQRATAALQAGEQLETQHSYKLVYDLLVTIIDGTPAMQIFTVYVLLFYTTHTEQYFTKNTHEHIMGKIMAQTQLQPTGEYREHSLLYDRTWRICFGDDTPHSCERDYADMRREFRIRDNHPLYFILNEIMRIKDFAPLTTTS